ncbi:dermonecrotic toxin domain-containing protein [Pseudomonas sp. FW300-N1B4]|uniref:dermonecrotic toxin domain-containing protein n=1 Tax=Pseudomonas sp. FW300-N1B4 TaxID=2751315 RepID=UPI001A938881|nr:DUF6543 domain-containing protein [Pseudomonas sp. FW300-N1B4]
MNIMNTSIPPANRPQWLEQVSITNQLHYGGLEQQLIANRVDLERQLRGHINVQVYARNLASQFLQLEFDSSLDPDTLMTISQYEFDEADCKIRQEDKRSLTDLLLWGLHEKGRRASITLEGEGIPIGLNQQWLEENWNGDVRASYGRDLRAAYERSAVLAAMKNVTRDQLLLSAFTAKLRGHLNDTNLQRIELAVNGYTNMTLAPLTLMGDGVRNTRPFAELVAIGSRSPSQDDWLLYAPDSPGGQDWYELPGFRQLDGEICSWMAKPEGQAYLVWRSHALDREVIAGYLKKISQRPDLWRGIQPVPTPYTGPEVLNTVVFNHRAWLVAQEESQTPYYYRTASDELRQTFTRINTELKALKTVEVREGGFITYERFCHQLIKQRVEEILLGRGDVVAIDPDRIYVQISHEQQMTLTRLIADETHFYAGNADRDKYPRFTMATDHPPLDKLDIRDIAGWSRTLRAGEQYIDMLRTTHVNRSHPEGIFKRKIYMGIMKRQMTVAAMQALFTGCLTRKHFEELKKVIAAFDHPQLAWPVGEAPGDVPHSALFKLHLKKRLVVGVFVFRLRIAGTIEQYLFTPDAPDGYEIRPFKDFVSAVKTRGLGDYLYDRVHEKYQPGVGAYLTDLEQLAHFTEAPELERNSRVTDLYDCYSDVVYKIISDVDAKTQSLEEIITGLVYNAVLTAVSVIGIVYPPVSIALSAALLTKNLVQGAEAYSEGNRAKALIHFRDALIELALLGKAGYVGSQPTKIQKDLIGLLGDVYTVEWFFSQATGQPRLHERVLEVIQQVLDDPQSATSKTTIIQR